MSDQTYSGLTVGARLDTYSSRYVVGLEIGGGFVPFAQVSQLKVDKWLPLTQPAEEPTPAPSESMAPSEAPPVSPAPQT